MRVVFVHGACVKDGAWWWHRTSDVLAERGVSSVAPHLPSCGETAIGASGDGPRLSDDVRAVRDVLAGSTEATVVVAHSYGGIVASEAIAGFPAVSHLVLVSSYLPEIGESLSTFGSEEPASFLDVDLDHGVFTVRPDSMATTFLQDCDPDIQDAAVHKTAWQSLSVLHQTVEIAAWKHLPTTYLVCSEDQGTPAGLQRQFAERADHVSEIATGHHPFLSRPSMIADVILAL